MPPTKTKRRPTAHRQPLSDQLRALIEAKGLTAYAVAQNSGLAPSVVNRFLNGERGLSSESLDRIGEALGLELREARRGRKTRA